jgi:hypothetical protein
VTQPDEPGRHAMPDPDSLDWDVAKHGRMADYATDAEDEPETVPYEPEQDDRGDIPGGPGDLADA